MRLRRFQPRTPTSCWDPERLTSVPQARTLKWRARQGRELRTPAWASLSRSRFRSVRSASSASRSVLEKQWGNFVEVMPPDCPGVLAFAGMEHVLDFVLVKQVG